MAGWSLAELSAPPAASGLPSLLFGPLVDRQMGAVMASAPDELVERLRGAGVLFDRSAAGDFLHIYTEGGEQGFFFEVVQRIGGYDAYGAANAPARRAMAISSAERIATCSPAIMQTPRRRRHAPSFRSNDPAAPPG